MTERKSLLPDDAVFPDDASRKMADEAAWDAADSAEAAAKAEEKPKPEPKEEPKEEPAKVEPKEEPKEDKKDEGKESADGKEEGKEDDPKPVPAWQFQVFKKQVGKQLEEIKALITAAQKPEATPEAKDKAADAAAGKVEEVDDALKAFSEKFGWDTEMLKELRKTLGIATVPKEVQEVVEAQKAEKAHQEQETGFQNELKEALESTPDYKDVDQAKLHELAFSDAYRSYKLSDIIRLNPDLVPAKPQGKPSMEGGKGGSRHDTSLDLTKEQPQDVILQMSNKQFAEYSDNMAKRSRNQLTRDGRPVKDE